MDQGASLAATLGQLREARSDLQPVPLSAVNDAIGSTYALLFAERVADGRVQNPVVEGVDAAYGDRLTRAAAHQMLPAWLHGLAPGTVLDRASLQRDHDFARSAFFDYVVRPEGRFHCLVTTPYVTPTQRFHMIVGRPMTQNDFSSDDVRVVRALLPHVGRLIASGVTLGESRSDATVLASALDRMPEAVILVSPGCRLVFANKGGRRLLNLGDGLRLAGGAVVTGAATTDAALRHAVALAIGPAASAAPIQVRRPSGLPPLNIRIRPLRDEPEPESAPGAQRAAEPALAMLEVGEPETPVSVDGGRLAREFGLTNKERDVVAHLARGLDLRGASVALGVSYHTARHHLRHVFAKTETHRQSELIRMVLASNRAER